MKDGRKKSRVGRWEGRKVKEGRTNRRKEGRTDGRTEGR